MHSDKFTLVRSPVYCKSEIHQKSVEKVFRSSQMYLNKENWSYSKKSGDFLTFKTKFAPKSNFVVGVLKFKTQSHSAILWESIVNTYRRLEVQNQQ